MADFWNINVQFQSITITPLLENHQNFKIEIINCESLSTYLENLYSFFRIIII